MDKNCHGGVLLHIFETAVCHGNITDIESPLVCLKRRMATLRLIFKLDLLILFRFIKMSIGGKELGWKLLRGFLFVVIIGLALFGFVFSLLQLK